LYFDTGLAVPLDDWRAVNVSRLLRELILHAVLHSPLYRRRPEHRRLVEVLLDQLAVLTQQPLLLPYPTDDRARALADAITDTADADHSLDAMASSVGASRRTLERVFLVETGLTIGAWRQRHRLLRALQLLADGRPVTEVAIAVGYRTPSAFTAMFHQQLGTTPSRYYDTTTAASSESPDRLPRRDPR
jgi:transcriptional regulator GlxA family with amidase domain